MKTPYSGSFRRVANSGQNRALVFWGGLAVVILLFILLVRIAVPGIFIAVTSPVLGTGTSLTAGVGNVFSGFTAKEKLAEANSVLMEENLELKNENTVLSARTQDLTKLLGGTSATGLNTQDELLSGVLARPPESPYDTLTISSGAADGVTLNATVFAQGGIPIGSIKHVYTHSAQVSLYSTAGRSTDGWVGEGRTPLTITGAGSGAFTSSIPKTSAVSVGDSVYVPGPGAVPIGTIIRIDSDASSPTVTLQIQPLVNLFTITWVEVSK
jgi:cell shape-determining protein MreC